MAVEPAEAERRENLRKLEDLWRAGILTDEEFHAKRKLLVVPDDSAAAR